MIISIEQSYDVIYECDACRRAPKMVTARNLDELRQACQSYGVYKCSRCEKLEKEEGDGSKKTTC